ncbi:MAG: hypothetical protein B5766_10205 [Candidatus Lumbricidophila eiseniae]|uniref:Uncharacterized protein n=1 Tax=Candidatus Lumbricidiphila eiseniae TaxID=1969409 RepID=A0A2A6FP67_9MICO|nr:MAG: hypothetical protein B5766_10205 [Candidatus Lumbricidophila eiseniae]
MAITVSFVLIAAASLTGAGVANADTEATNDEITSQEIGEALFAVKNATGLIEEVVTAGTNSNSAAVTRTLTGDVVSIPKNPFNDITIISKDQTKITISLPGVNNIRDTNILADGTVTYPANTGTANAAIPTATGVQLLTTIANPKASQRFDYRVGLPTGYHLALTVAGGAQVTDSYGQAVATVSPAWAADSMGKPVSTHYEVIDSTLTQVINHTSEKFSYPIVADPNWVQQSIAVTAGIAAGTAAVVAFKLPPSVGWAIGGCVQGALSAMFDGQDFWGTLNRCVSGVFTGLLGKNFSNWLTRFLGSRGIST